MSDVLHAERIVTLLTVVLEIFDAKGWHRNRKCNVFHEQNGIVNSLWAYDNPKLLPLINYKYEPLPLVTSLLFPAERILGQEGNPYHAGRY